MDEAENLQKRKVQFDMNELAKVAAASVGAQCTSITKYPDGMFNKAFLLSMDNGQEVVAKVPNPNAGVPHLTTASEVATIDFVWTSQAASLRLADMMEFRQGDSLVHQYPMFTHGIHRRSHILLGLSLSSWTKLQVFHYHKSGML